MKYIVPAPSYDPNNGGAIFQHLLVNALNSLGETAYLAPQPDIYPPGKRERLKRLIKPRPYLTSPELNTPVFKGKFAPA